MTSAAVPAAAAHAVGQGGAGRRGGRGEPPRPRTGVPGRAVDPGPSGPCRCRSAIGSGPCGHRQRGVTWPWPGCWPGPGARCCGARRGSSPCRRRSDPGRLPARQPVRRDRQVPARTAGLAVTTAHPDPADVAGSVDRVGASRAYRGRAAGWRRGPDAARGWVAGSARGDGLPVPDRGKLRPEIWHSAASRRKSMN